MCILALFSALLSSIVATTVSVFSRVVAPAIAVCHCRVAPAISVFPRVVAPAISVCRVHLLLLSLLWSTSYFV